MIMRKISALLLVIMLSVPAQNYSQNKSGRKVEPVGKKELEKLIKERNGKILFLNLWATWCVPCREEFPAIVKLAGEMKNVEFVTLSIDYPDEVNSKIIPFLDSFKADFVSYVSGIKGDEELINFFDKKWNGALPATFIYDGNGTKKAFLQGGRSYEEFKSELEKVIN